MQVLYHISAGLCGIIQDILRQIGACPYWTEKGGGLVAWFYGLAQKSRRFRRRLLVKKLKID